MKGYVYFIACVETMRVKIGFTKGNPIARLKALQTGSASTLVLMACHPGSLETERDLHNRFAAHRVHGEWFEASEEMLEYLSMIVWLTACHFEITGGELPSWVDAGLRSMHQDKPLPDNLAALIGEVVTQ